MPEAWIPLLCPDCGDDWQASPASLPRPDAEFSCPECGHTERTAAFTKTRRSLDILREFHGSAVDS